MIEEKMLIGILMAVNIVAFFIVGSDKRKSMDPSDPLQPVSDRTRAWRLPAHRRPGKSVRMIGAQRREPDAIAED